MYTCGLLLVVGMMGNSQAMKNAIMSVTAGTDGTISQFSEPDLLDDLRDHWTSADHSAERQMVVRKLQVMREALKHECIHRGLPTYASKLQFSNGSIASLVSSATHSAG